MSETSETKIAILNVQMKSVEKKVDEGFTQINKKMDDLNTSINTFHDDVNARFATQKEVDDVKFGLKRDIEDIKRIATTRTYWAIGGSTLFSATLTALIYYFISNQVK